MKIRKEQTENSVFSVGRIFVDEFLDRISGNGVKLYLYLLCQFENGGNFYEPTARNKLRFSVQEYDAAVKELADYGLIYYEKGQFLELAANENIAKGKQKFVDAGFAGKLQADSGLAGEFKTVIETVSREFFDGKMSVFWYNFCEKCVKEYEFQPETVYLLFHECESFKNRSYSGFTSYVKKVAETWYQSRVKTPEDVATLSDRWNKRNAFVKFVQKKLNFARNFTEAETTAITSWLDSGVTEEMLSVVLDDKNRVSAMTIEKIDNVVNEWKANGVKTPEDAKKHVNSRKNTQNVANSAKKGGNTQVHFENERKYTDADLDEILRRNDDGGQK